MDYETYRHLKMEILRTRVYIRRRRRALLATYREVLSGQVESRKNDVRRS